MTLYFAYGSNLCEARMAFRCPAAVPVTAARLYDYRLMFRSHGKRSSGVANILRHEGFIVPGAVWDLTDACLATLDIYEGAPIVYDRLTVEVWTPTGMLQCITYEMVCDHEPAVPSEDYFCKIFSGYKDFALDRMALCVAVQEADSAAQVLASQRAREAQEEADGELEAPPIPMPPASKRRKKRRGVPQEPVGV